jgi:hypothetical protein
VKRFEFVKALAHTTYVTRDLLVVLQERTHNWRIIERPLDKIKPKLSFAKRATEGNCIALTKAIVQSEDSNFASIAVAHLEILRQEEVQLEARQKRFESGRNMKMTRWRAACDFLEDT